MRYNNFFYSFPTQYIFGKDSIVQLQAQLERFAVRRVVVFCGKNSSQALGIIEIIEVVLKKQCKGYFIIDNCVSNPSDNFIIDSKQQVKSFNADFLLAIGGGSVIDTAKAVAYQLVNDVEIGIGVILTVPASGSESNRSFVISSCTEEKKIALADTRIIPKFAICDPAYTETLSRKQIFSACADIMGHLLEQFFALQDWSMIDYIIIACIKTLDDITKILLRDFNNADARQELVMISSFSLSYFLSCGRTMDWVAHTIEHAVSGKYKTNHGEGISIIMPKWLRFSSDNIYYNMRLKKLAIELNFESNIEADIMEAGLDYIEKFYAMLGLAKTLNEMTRTIIDEKQLAKAIINDKAIGRVNVIDIDDCYQVLLKCNYQFSLYDS